MTGFLPGRDRSSDASYGEINSRKTRLQIVVSKGGTQRNGNQVKLERQQHRPLSPVVNSQRVGMDRYELY